MDEDEDDDMPRVFITVERKHICDEVAARLLQRAKDRPTDHAELLHLAESRGWKSPS